MPKIFGWLVLFAVVSSIFLTGCQGSHTNPAATRPPASTTKADPTTSAATPTPTFDEKVVIQETQKVGQTIADAIAAGDSRAVIAHLEHSTQLQLFDLDLASPKAQQLAAAITGARVTRTFSNMAFYESTLGTETITFYYIKEDGVWKLAGF
jgi:hypothetical protein